MAKRKIPKRKSNPNMKLVKVDMKTWIEVPFETTNEDAINKYNEVHNKSM